MELTRSRLDTSPLGEEAGGLTWRTPNPTGGIPAPNRARLKVVQEVDALGRERGQGCKSAYPFECPFLSTGGWDGQTARRAEVLEAMSLRPHRDRGIDPRR